VSKNESKHTVCVHKFHTYIYSIFCSLFLSDIFFSNIFFSVFFLLQQKKVCSPKRIFFEKFFINNFFTFIYCIFLYFYSKFSTIFKPNSPLTFTKLQHAISNKTKTIFFNPIFNACAYANFNTTQNAS